MTDPPKKALTLEELNACEPTQNGPDGMVTDEHLRWQAQIIMQAQIDAILGRRELPKGVNLSQTKDLLETQAKLNKKDLKRLLDNRTEAQKYEDATKELIETPLSIFEAVDGQLDEMERQVAFVNKYATDKWGASNQALRDARLAKKEQDRIEASKKAWGERIRRLKNLREQARNPFPKGSAPGNKPAIASVHLLRFMVYVGRTEDGHIYSMAEHHCQMAMALYEAEFRRMWSKDKLEWMDVKFTGFLGVMPPGHGKTVLATHWCGLRIAENPKIRGLMGHAQAGMAEQNLQFVTAMVDPETAQGRRLRSLYPDVPPIRKKTTDTLDLETSDGEKKKAPTLMAYGVTAKISGSDADFILFDDICDQEIAEQETTRKRVFDRMNGTWRRRLREKPTGDGHWPFEVTIGTLWHHDDPNARRIEMAKNKSIKLRVKVLKCGGPDDGFKPVWPEVYGSAKLKSIYTEMRNPHLYAAQYQANPLPLELRKIKRLAYYLPGDKAHADFLQTSINHVTIDPAGTNHAKSDKSSYVYGACGDLITKRTDGSVEYVRRLRIVDGRELTANQSEIVQHVCAFAEMNSTHYIHCEMVGGYEAMRDFFEARDLDVIAHQPHGKGKDVRLGHVSSMLDDSLRDKGFPGAVVEFPGMIRPDGTLGPDPESPLAWLEDQILNFGVAKGDHGVDALVYLCKHLGPELSVADGAVTKTLQINRNLHADPRINRMLDYFARDQDTRKTAGQEENDFMAGSEQEMW